MEVHDMQVEVREAGRCYREIAFSGTDTFAMDAEQKR
jgi:hypothetical protein